MKASRNRLELLNTQPHISGHMDVTDRSHPGPAGSTDGYVQKKNKCRRCVSLIDRKENEYLWTKEQKELELNNKGEITNKRVFRVHMVAKEKKWSSNALCAQNLLKEPLLRKWCRSCVRPRVIWIRRIELTNTTLCAQNLPISFNVSYRGWISEERKIPRVSEQKEKKWIHSWCYVRMKEIWPMSCQRTKGPLIAPQALVAAIVIWIRRVSEQKEKKWSSNALCAQKSRRNWNWTTKVEKK